ncbi:MAG: LD-carboxypeptidase [Ginsengibacter sp.]
MIKFPESLKPGDTIALTCPAGYMPLEKMQKCIKILKEWGYNVRLGKTIGTQYNYFSANDNDRLSDLQSLIDDPLVKASLCARGGYGTGRIVDRINFKTFRKHPKWIIGFSDITILHSHLVSKYKISSLNAPMAGAFNDFPNEYLDSLKNALSGLQGNYICPPHNYDQKGNGKGRLVGGNLSLLCHLIGTASDINTNGKILFLEDVGEYIYNIDRMMYQLKRAHKFEGLAGLIIGGFTEIKDTLIPFGQSAQEVIKEIVKNYNFPVAFNFPVSHSVENYALKIGAKYQLGVGDEFVSLLEIR